MDSFRMLLFSVAQHINSDELEHLKFACSGVIPAGRSEDITSPLDLFLELQRIDKLTENNRGFLANVLAQIGRQDLSNKLLEISASSTSNTTVDKNLVTDEIIHSISEDVSVQWKNIGRRLKLKEAAIQSIDNDCRRTQEKAQQMLVKWKQRTESPKVQILMDACIKAGRRDLAEKLEEYIKTPTVPKELGKQGWPKISSSEQGQPVCSPSEEKDCTFPR